MIDSTQMKRRTKHTKRDARRGAILRVALEIFSERGYKGTSLSAILARAGGSKRNFYTEFGGKEGLFKTLVSRSIERRMREQVAEDGDGQDLRRTLTGVARRLVSGFADPEMLGLYRLALADGLLFPEMAEAFFNAAPRQVEAYVEKVLNNAAARGEVAAGDYAAAAGFFIGMLHRKLFSELFFNMKSAFGENEVETFVASAVGVFLDGVQRNGSAVASAGA